MTMDDQRQLTALGLMSGTSLDGIDAAVVRTDGRVVSELGAAITIAYPAPVRRLLGDAIAAAGGHRRGEPWPDVIIEAQEAITDRAVQVVHRLLEQNVLTKSDINIIGFHGQTVLHRPEVGWTWQIGDGRRLAEAAGIDVVGDFRSADVAAGGQGAPLAPLYHLALADSPVLGLAGKGCFPLAVLNIGGVANVTWMGKREGGAGRPVMAFDTGPGNAMIDDWMARRTGTPLDRDGATAAKGKVDARALAALLDNPYFQKKPPKSLDRNSFPDAALEGLSTADGAATLTRFTVEAVALAARHMPAPPRRWLVCGGGRHNPGLMAGLAQRLAVPVAPVEAVGWRGDSLEAELIGFLAMRSRRGLPLGLAGTTGVRRPVSGGILFPAPGK